MTSRQRCANAENQIPLRPAAIQGVSSAISALGTPRECRGDASPATAFLVSLLHVVQAQEYADIIQTKWEETEEKPAVIAISVASCVAPPPLKHGALSDCVAVLCCEARRKRVRTCA